MCKKVTYPYAMQFVPDWYKTQEKWGRDIDVCLFVFNVIFDWFKTQEMCDEVVSKETVTLKCCLNRY